MQELQKRGRAGTGPPPVRASVAQRYCASQICWMYLRLCDGFTM
jgi:hypothetical protein